MTARGIVFCDADGTLLDSRHTVLPGTLMAFEALRARGIPMVIVSARSPAGIRPIQREHGLNGPIAAYSGALTIDEDQTAIRSVTFPLARALEIISCLESLPQKTVWNLFSGEHWLTPDPADPRVRAEENIVKTRAGRYVPGALPEDTGIHTLLIMGGSDTSPAVEEALRKAFPHVSIRRSSDILLEIMAEGVGKDAAVMDLCARYGVPPDQAVAFGDQFNDEDMLRAVGTPVVMGNAPRALKELFPFVTEDNDHEGIFNALKKLGMI